MHPYSEQPLQLFGLECKEEVSLVKLTKVISFVHVCVWCYSLLAWKSLVNIQIRSTTCRFMLTVANNLAIKPGPRDSCMAVCYPLKSLNIYKEEMWGRDTERGKWVLTS